jgi:hypothetical protein
VGFKHQNATFCAILNRYNKLILRQNNLCEHSIPERRGITHGSEAKGKKKMHLYAHNRMYKSIAFILNGQTPFS